jgi:hypothetical protein
VHREDQGRGQGKINGEDRAGHLDGLEEIRVAAFIGHRRACLSLSVHVDPDAALLLPHSGRRTVADAVKVSSHRVQRLWWKATPEVSGERDLLRSKRDLLYIGIPLGVDHAAPPPPRPPPPPPTRPSPAPPGRGGAEAATAVGRRRLKTCRGLTCQ